MITTSAELEELIDSTVSIPTIPTTLLEIQRVCSSPDGSAKEASDVIECDPAIAAKVLRLVNSSFYSLKNPVSSISLACSILGLKVLKNLVVQATVLDSFGAGPEVAGFDPTFLWDHSFKTAKAASLLAGVTTADVGLDKDDAYTCGLVHDVGKMLLLQNVPEQFGEALAVSRDKAIPLAKAEGELLGFSHAHVGGLLAQRWKLSRDLQVAVMYHHSPASDAEDWAKGFLIKAANTIAHQVAEGDGGWRGDLTDDDSMAALGIPADKLDEIRDEVAAASMGN